jgi:hypothetical protein
VPRKPREQRNEATCFRPPSILDEARRLVAGFVEHYNTRRLHSAIDDVTLAGRQDANKAAPLEAVRDKRACARRALRREQPPVRPSSPQHLDRPRWIRQATYPRFR